MIDDRLRNQQRQNELNAFLRYEQRLKQAYANSQDPFPRREDGSLMVTVGEFKSMVSSHHLVQEKIIRLTSYWLKAHGHDGDHTGHQV